MIGMKTKTKEPLYEDKADIGILITKLDRATFSRMVMRANLPPADSRALMAAFDEAKR